MAVSYNGLWKLLIDKNMKKMDLMNRVEISSSTVAKMTNGELVSLKVLEKICAELDCDFGDIIHYEKKSRTVGSNGIQCKNHFGIILVAGIQKNSGISFERL